MVVNISSLSVNEPEGVKDKDTEASVFLWVRGYSVSLLPPCLWRKFSVGSTKVRSRISFTLIPLRSVQCWGGTQGLSHVGKCSTTGPHPNLRL